nr:DUF1294 domain-containing protein [Tautonia sociabilis]
MNLATIAVWAWDKHRSVRDGRRVPERALLGLAAIGGSLGALVGVFGLGHKRRKGRFVLALAAILAAQAALAAALLASG